MSQDIAKKAAAKAAISFIKPNMTLGLGSGSTSEFFIHYLIEEVKKGLSIQAVCSSKYSETIAKNGGIPVKGINEVDTIDLTIDGADEIDPQKRMIKGGGGAHVREKILAFSSQEMYIIVDSSKCVEKLGKRKLPVEIVTYGHRKIPKILKEKNFPSDWRKTKENTLFLTDNGNYILDVDIASQTIPSEKIHTFIKNLPGVVDTGFFFNLAKKVLIGTEDGKATIID